MGDDAERDDAPGTTVPGGAGSAPPDEGAAGPGTGEAGAATGARATTVVDDPARDPDEGTGTDPDASPYGPADAEPGEPAEPRRTAFLRRLLGDDALALDATPRDRLHGWLWALAVTALGGVLRFWDLARPHALVFDETYYVKQAFSLLARGYEAAWGDDPNPGFEAGDTSMLGTDPEYVVHPLVGKWMIALGMQLGGGVESSAAWRLSAAVVGTLAVLMVARIGRRLFASTALGTVAGLFLAVDGLAIVHSRISLLDPFLMFFALAAFGALVLDRQQARRRLADRAAAVLDAGGTLRWGPGLGFRWWRLAAGVLLGLAVGTKWSGMYFLAVFGVMTVLWDMAARRAVGVRAWHVAGAVKDGLVAFVVLVGSAALTYVASWASWFASDNAWNRHWAEQNPGQGVGWLPPALRSWWQYHEDMWRFHNGLETPHSYAAHPIGWIVQWRPTSYYYPSEISGLTGPQAQAACGADSCSQAILAVGNPVIWWAGAAAVLVALFWLIRYRDWRAGAALSGIVAGWVPWFAYAHRTIFTFYSVAFAPWVVLTLVYVLGLLVGPVSPEDTERDRRGRRRAIVGVGVFVVLVVAAGPSSTRCGRAGSCRGSSGTSACGCPPGSDPDPGDDPDRAPAGR
ncbi:dolichyl-phosphate-mannose--protein mannosyltransferase [Cellulomonas sp. JZ18]|uniref:dolichyl-phosphate-mannose--protein mannosyltransferase n=1 Tax=Cellulomonas sp. JZ18 TaxID=2654191 RepID=UPI001E2F75E9|nr:phospholipid carrier-dependent glycosyltransferase [Cellulomonas sp. JZ18]